MRRRPLNEPSSPSSSRRRTEGIAGEVLWSDVESERARAEEDERNRQMSAGLSLAVERIAAMLREHELYGRPPNLQRFKRVLEITEEARAMLAKAKENLGERNPQFRILRDTIVQARDKKLVSVCRMKLPDIRRSTTRTARKYLEYCSSAATKCAERYPDQRGWFAAVARTFADASEARQLGVFKRLVPTQTGAVTPRELLVQFVRRLPSRDRWTKQ
jgi:hypothetical protein